MPAEIEALQQKELDEEALPLTEDAEKSEKSVTTSGDNPVDDEKGLVLEGSSGGDVSEETVKETLEDLVPEVQEEVLPKEADTAEPVTNEPEAVLPSGDQTSEPISETTLELVPTEPSLSSEEQSSQH